MLVWSRLLDAIDRHGRAAMVTIVAAKGSVPREAGARLIVHPDGTFTGTVGGGTLEWRAIAIAQSMLASPTPRMFDRRKFALGPELGQCCGGHVELILELLGGADRSMLATLAAREAKGPFATRGRLSSGGGMNREFVDEADVLSGSDAYWDGDVLLERFGEETRPLLLFGAGHVGRALALSLAPLPFSVTWVDPRPGAFPSHVPGNVTPLQIGDPVAALRTAGEGTFVLVMSHSHALDLAIVTEALALDRFPYVGLIGSATKRARFEKRLSESGIRRQAIDRLVCPIGIAGIKSKAPAAIAVATTAEMLVLDEAIMAGRIGFEPPKLHRLKTRAG